MIHPSSDHSLPWSRLALCLSALAAAVPVTAAAVVPAGAHASAADDGGPARERIVPDERLLARVQEALALETTHKRLEALLAIGTPLAGIAFDLAVGRAEGVALGPEKEQLLHIALARLPAAEAGLAIVARLGTPPDHAEALVAGTLLSEVGNVAAVLAWIDAMSRAEVPWASGERFQARVALALGRALEREPAGVERVREWLGDAPVPLLSGPCSALAESGGLAGLKVVGRALGRDPALDVALIDVLGRPDPGGDAARDQARIELVRPFLASDSTEARRLALRSLAGLHDARSLPEMVDLLGDPDRGVARCASDALAQLAGRDFGAGDAGAWLRWHDAELAWLEQQAPRLVEVALEGESGAAVRALRELAAHPFLRRELALSIEPVLARDDALAAGGACDALARLGARSAIARLEEVRAERAELAQPAAQALAALRKEPPAAR